jgi:hypothetical protein
MSLRDPLTPLGRSPEQPIRSIAAWAEQNMTRITRARNAYDRRVAGPASEADGDRRSIRWRP